MTFFSKKPKNTHYICSWENNKKESIIQPGLAHGEVQWLVLHVGVMSWPVQGGPGYSQRMQLCIGGMSESCCMEERRLTNLLSVIVAEGPQMPQEESMIGMKEPCLTLFILLSYLLRFSGSCLW